MIINLLNWYYLQKLSTYFHNFVTYNIMLNLKPKIINYETQLNSKVVYIVQVTDENTHRTKVTKLRYSEFKSLHAELQKLIAKLKLHIVLPQFPSRKMFGSTNKSQEAIFERKKQLNYYLNDLLSIQKLHCLDIIKKSFIPQGEGMVQKSQPEIHMQICIDRYTLVEDVVIYYVRLRDLDTHQEWTFKTRYSQLRNVHDALEESKVKGLPEFPKKKIFGITNQSPQNIQKRRQELQIYFNEIFNNKQAMNSDALKYYIIESQKQANRDKELEMLKKKKNEK